MSTQPLSIMSLPKTNRVSPALFLRIASVLTVLHCIGHTIGGVFSVDAPPGTKEGAVVSTMKSNQFDVMGATRSFWDFFIGFGLTISVSSLLQAVVFWQLAGLAKTDPVESGQSSQHFCLLTSVLRYLRGGTSLFLRL